jgi:hypothetical protein
MKTLISNIVIAATLISIATGDAQVVNESSADAIDQDLIQTAQRWASSCPKTVDSNTQLETVWAMHRQLVFQFIVTLPEGTKADIAKLKRDRQNAYDTDPDPAHFRANGVSFRFSYRDQDGRYICDFVIGK